MLRALLSLFLVSLAAAKMKNCKDSLTWSTANGQIQVNGQPFALKGVSWFGFETETFAPHGMWSNSMDKFLDFIENNDFNAIRVPFSLEMVRDNPSNINIDCGSNPGLCGKTALELLDVLIQRSADRGLLIMLDNHHITHGGGISPLWYNDEYPESTVIELWKKLLDRYRDSWNVFAIELKNEPHDAATWGNSNPNTDWNKAAERMIQALSSFNGFFFVDGVEWGGRMEGVAENPIDTGSESLNNRVVYSPHCYGPDVYDRDEFKVPEFPNNLDGIYMGKYGFVTERTGQPTIISEWGGHMNPGTRDETWNRWFVDWLRAKNMANNFYWCLNPNSGDTGGLLEDDWTTPIPRKLDLVRQLQPNPTKFKTRKGQVCVMQRSI